MWKDYSKSYIKNNRASSISVMVAALIATLFLSLLCSLFFNFWTYEIEQIELDEGDWQGRITGEIDEGDLAVIQNFANVEKAVINEDLSDEETVVDIYFRNTGRIYQDMPLITARLGLDNDAAKYHSLLLSRYFIHDPQDEEPPLLMAFYVAILIVVSFSLILIIRNSFEVSMSARIHQFGILSGIGAAPKQIRTCLLQEAAVLCTAPILAGSLSGIAISVGVIEAVNIFAANAAGRHQAVFQYHPLVLLVTVLAAVLTVLVSAWMPARKLSKMTPLTAIRNAGGLQLKKKRNSRVLSLMFGIEGELAGNALKAQKKSLRTSTLSLLLSFLGFTIMLCFFTLSGISTRYTYFERYQDVWDVMVTVKNTELINFGLKEEVQEIPGVRDSVVYQKAEEASLISKDWQSEELMSLGGLEAVAGTAVSGEEDSFRAASPIIILDDDSFLEYCSQLGITPELDGVIVRNLIWDSINSSYLEKEYLPFVKENREMTALISTGQESVEIPILSYTREVPVLREEYADYALVHFIPLSLWETVSEQMSGAEQTTYIRILANEEPGLDELNALEDIVVQLVGQDYVVESENRILEKVSNDDMIRGSMIILGAFCSLLAIIGIANVFSNTLGFLRQRKREFAQYLSIGLTPAMMQKMFCIEALVIAGRPLLITLPLTVAAAAFMITASHLDPMVFLAEAPLLPILIFDLFIIGFVSLAYYIGGKRLLQCDLSEALRNDTLI